MSYTRYALTPTGWIEISWTNNPKLAERWMASHDRGAPTIVIAGL